MKINTVFNKSLTRPPNGRTSTISFIAIVLLGYGSSAFSWGEEPTGCDSSRSVVGEFGEHRPTNNVLSIEMVKTSEKGKKAIIEEKYKDGYLVERKDGEAGNLKRFVWKSGRMVEMKLSVERNSRWVPYSVTAYEYDQTGKLTRILEKDAASRKTIFAKYVVHAKNQQGSWETCTEFRVTSLPSSIETLSFGLDGRPYRRSSKFLDYRLPENNEASIYEVLRDVASGGPNQFSGFSISYRTDGDLLLVRSVDTYEWYDKKGRRVEFASTYDGKEDQRHVYKYTDDNQGNWIAMSHLEKRVDSLNAAEKEWKETAVVQRKLTYR